METVYFSLATILSVLIVWYIMQQRTKKLVLESKMEANIILAGIEAKEHSLNESLKGYETAMKDTFTVLAQTAFEEAVAKADNEKTTTFNAATETLSKSLKEYTENMNKIEAKSLERGTRLEERINSVSELGLKLSDETNNLTRALKADSQAQGAWGELVLENLLQSMGFVEGKDYTKQLSETASDGKRKRTDFIIYLPDNRQVIIDSKVSLKAWEQYINAQTEDEAELAMKEHCKSIAGHAKGLASKRYQDMETINSVEFVLMFVPLESAFGAAMRQSPELYMDLAGNVNVKVVTGATIMTALLLIKDMWKREHQSQNQVKLIEQAGGLHDQIILFLESFEGIGSRLKQATASYEEAYDRLVKNRGNVIKRTDGLKQLGAKVKKNMDTNLLEEGNYNHENATTSNEEE
jgi:DNA recombination protein RmuC